MNMCERCFQTIHSARTHFTHIAFDPWYQPTLGPTCGCKHLVETKTLRNKARRSTGFYCGPTVESSLSVFICAWPVLSAALLCPAKRQTHCRPPVPFHARAEMLSDIRHGKWASAASRVKRSRLDHPGQIKQPFHVWSACSPKDKSHWVLSLNSGPMFPLRCRCNFLAWLLWLLHTGGKMICYRWIVIKFATNTSVVPLKLHYMRRRYDGLQNRAWQFNIIIYGLWVVP